MQPASRLPLVPGLLALVLAAVALPLSAQQVPATAPAAASMASAGTGDVWIDKQLADIDAYAARYPDAFIDELTRYAGARPGYMQALLEGHGWTPGQVYFACFWGQISKQGYRALVQAHSQQPEAGWKAIVDGLQPPPDNLQWRALRHAIVASYDHWDRPIQLDALLQRQLGDRARRDAAAREAAGGN